MGPAHFENKKFLGLVTYKKTACIVVDPDPDDLWSLLTFYQRLKNFRKKSYIL